MQLVNVKSAYHCPFFILCHTNDYIALKGTVSRLFIILFLNFQPKIKFISRDCPFYSSKSSKNFENSKIGDYGFVF
jgi:hypothetical protein